MYTLCSDPGLYFQSQTGSLISPLRNNLYLVHLLYSYRQRRIFNVVIFKQSYLRKARKCVILALYIKATNIKHLFNVLS